MTYVKTKFKRWQLDLAGEAARLTWAVEFAAVPRVLDQDADGDGAWLVTAALPGRSAVDPRWRGEPRTAVMAIGEGLRALHEALPVADCPFSWTAEDRVAAWSTEWNYGPGWERLLLDAYGVRPDPERSRYYRLLWDIGP
jgi:kanamycin kinase